jgi:hypothetical protein
MTRIVAVPVNAHSATRGAHDDLTIYRPASRATRAAMILDEAGQPIADQLELY